MLRRDLLKGAAAAPLAAGLATPLTALAGPRRSRVRPGQSGWPDAAAWAALSAATGGRLIKLDPPFAAAAAAPDSPATAALFKSLRNPFFIGDSPILTQTLGWTDAWTSQPSAYAVAANSAADVAAAVKFARWHSLRLVVKGGGHSYLGGSNAADSLLVWTRPMQDITVHDAFTPAGCPGPAQPAVSVGAGAIWLQAYQAVTGGHGRYVQGGGCTTVGVPGLVTGGGFGSFSKGFGTGAASLLEAEVVTADGQVCLANACTNPDLFWALKGGGGGTFGVVTRMTLMTHDLPAMFGSVSGAVTAKSDAAYSALVTQLLSFYRTALFNPHWGEQITFRFPRQIAISMVFQGLTQAEAAETWRPFFDWVAARPDDYVPAKPSVLALPAKLFWNAALLESVPGVVKTDDRPNAPKDHFFWAGDANQVGQVIHGYQSTWLSQSLLQPDKMPALVDALVHCARRWGVSLHCNKGLAGAPADALARSADTSTNPAMLDAFALAISGGGEGPAYPGVAGHEPHVEQGRRDAATLAAAMAPLMALRPRPASYISETDFGQPDWQTAFWGEHYPRLARIKARYDPDGLFFVHHSVGSEGWSADGFTRA
jgi:FAD/FMN-containing dehydrogenase